MCQGGDSGARVRIKAGYFAGREGTLAPEEGGNDPARMRVLFKRDGFAFFNLGDLEFLPPTRDVTAILCGVGYWQQQDPMKRRVHFTAEPAAPPYEAIALAIEARLKDIIAPYKYTDSYYMRGWSEAADFVRTLVPQSTTHVNLQGHVVTVHVAFPGDPLSRSIRFTTPLSAAEVVEALDHLVSQPAGTRARATTPEAEALAIHADRTPAYYGPAEGIS